MTKDFPTAEDIEVEISQEFGIVFNLHGKFNRTEAESLKQQIISNNEIVERLKEEINKTLYLLNTISPNIPPQTTAYEMYKEFHEKLKSILEKK